MRVADAKAPLGDEYFSDKNWWLFILEWLFSLVDREAGLACLAWQACVVSPARSPVGERSVDYKAFDLELLTTMEWKWSR